MTLVFALGSCTTRVSPETFEHQCTQIVGGEIDPDDPGVMALLGPDESLVCSGTLIAADPTPVLLTAAHCFDHLIALVAAGADYHAKARLTFAIGDFLIDPRFDRATGTYDFGLVLLEGAVDPSWVMPVVSAADDDIGPGTAVRFVGYGSTQDESPNTSKNDVGGKVTSVNATSFDYAQTDGGPCAGDSGGPALVERDGREVVAGVTSYGEGGCRERGVSARVSAASAFISNPDTFTGDPSRTNKEPSSCN
jgi:hypothetical protein